MGLLKDFISARRNDFSFEEISIAETIKSETGIDIVVDGEAALIAFLKLKYPTYVYTQNFQLINYYIQQEVEPLSKGRCVFFTQYPACTLSLARYDGTTKEIVRRFEFFIDGIEVSNGYENSLDVDEFVERNKNVSMFTAEEQYLEKKLRQGLVPIDTSIIGIGVERLCMTIYNIPDIQPLFHENTVF
jgi:lysyl-tRNA synthetase class 2